MSNAQNKIDIKAELDTINHELNIQQSIVFYNKRSQQLEHLYLHNWANSFKDNKTPLSKRLVEDYKKDFYFAKETDRGFSKIYSILFNNSPLQFSEEEDHPDIIKVKLDSVLKPNDSVRVFATYKVKIPNAKFTGYGKTKRGYHLRFWYLTPAVYQNGWQTMSNLNMNDLFQDVSDYTITLKTPKPLYVESNLYQYKTDIDDSFSEYFLIGKNKKDIIINISPYKRFKHYQTKSTQIKSDIFDRKIDIKTSTALIDRQIEFIENSIGKQPHVEILIDSYTVNKKSIQEVYGLPNWLKPYPENFKWEIRFFKALTSKYIDNILLLNKRTDYWLTEGIQTFLMMEYLDTYYPDITLFGKYSKVWGFRSYRLAKLKQKDKFAFLYQFSARKYYDQALTTRSDSLSNFNRKVISPFKAGLGLKYLQDFVGDNILKTSFKEFYHKKKLKISNTQDFANIIKRKTDKNLDWFFGDYLQTSKKIDYKIKEVKLNTSKDSLNITIKNKSNITTPVSLYGVFNKDIKFKTWVTGVDSTKTVTIPTNGFNKLALNYENIYPEHNSLNNFSKINSSFLKKPIQFRFLKDIQDPYYNQLFFNPNVKFNLYDGVILGGSFHNKPIIENNFGFNISPNYATNTQSLTGSVSAGFNQFYENSKLYRIRYGISTNYFHYDKDLSYSSLSPSISIQFRRNTLRDVGRKYLLGRYISINREIAAGETKLESDKYSLFNLKYVYRKPNIIRNLQYTINSEFSSSFTKLSTDIRYQKFFDKYESYSLRFFGGYFLSNTSKDNYFDFALNRSSDYLFELQLFGRSEKTGLLSQQFVQSDGSFKSFFNQDSYANQFIVAGNTSFSLWKWLEFYNDAAILKNRHEAPRFFYENGIRLNFIENIFEFYFPIYTNEGWEVNQHAYPTKIRFTLTTNIGRVYNFLRRGLL